MEVSYIPHGCRQSSSTECYSSNHMHCCPICLEIKTKNDFYNYKNKYEQTCKQCKKAINCEQLLCECGRYYTRTHYKRHVQTQLHKQVFIKV